MKKIIVNIVLAILALVMLFAVIYGNELTNGFDGWQKLLAAAISIIMFGVNSSIIVSYLDPEEDDF